jgi:hypothetical protein
MNVSSVFLFKMNTGDVYTYTYIWIDKQTHVDSYIFAYKYTYVYQYTLVIYVNKILSTSPI